MVDVVIFLCFLKLPHFPHPYQHYRHRGRCRQASQPACISYYLLEIRLLFFSFSRKSSLHFTACGTAAAALCQTLLVFGWFVSPFKGFTATYSSWNEYIHHRSVVFISIWFYFCHTLTTTHIHT